MPTYEYACGSCAHEWETEQSIKDAALTECPQCHQASAKRQISRGTGFILKGSGWYSDLYASSANKPPSKADGSSEGKGSEGKSSGNAGSSSGDGGGSTGGGSTGGSSPGGSSSTSANA